MPNILSMSPKEVAQNQRCPVVLPALQRGAVWRAYQVEEIWDSLLRGFPIGSFLLAPLKGNEGLGQRPVANADVAKSPEYYLLDGQQRWSAISLGFRNIWISHSETPVKSNLWLDLAPPENPADTRQFIFRVVSRAHPWGFKRDNPRNRMEASRRRDALHAYEKAYSGSAAVEFRPIKAPLIHTWPWDAIAPIPFAILLKLVAACDPPEAVWGKVQEALQHLPYWHADKLESLHDDWKDNVLHILNNPGPFQRKIIKGTERVLGLADGEPYHIPVQILWPDSVVEDDVDDNPGLQDAERAPDGIETLFVRINSLGTPLEGEELRYSILKSAFPAVQEIVDTLGTNLMSPARLVTLVSRLALDRIDRDKVKKEPPGEPDVGRFRRLVNDRKSTTFRDTICFYLGIDESGRPISGSNGPATSGRAKDLLDLAVDLLVNKNNKWGVPQVLVADLARSTAGVEALYFLLAWLDRVLDAGISVANICDGDRRRLVGTVTTLGWFAERPFDCLRALWRRMNEIRLDQLFSAGLMLVCTEPNEKDQLLLIPPLPPSFLSESLESNILKAPGFDDPSGGKIWTEDWSWSHNFPAPSSADKWLRGHFDSYSEDNMKGSWQGLIEKLLAMRSLIIYAQRETISKWFEGYDPAGPDQTEDTDRPWDFDHIHPSNYGVGGVNSLPRVIRAWHNSIGNLRAWPLEVNRNQGDTAPGLKLDDPSSKERESPYYLNTGAQIRTASCISETMWPHWRASTPDGRDPIRHNYLVYPDDSNFGPCRLALIQAITARWVALYREWYDQLRIASLFDPASS